jgi:hypothetical protein
VIDDRPVESLASVPLPSRHVRLPRTSRRGLVASVVLANAVLTTVIVVGLHALGV